jgi:hypothetical protein
MTQAPALGLLVGNAAAAEGDEAAAGDGCWLPAGLGEGVGSTMITAPPPTATEVEEAGVGEGEGERDD